MNVKELAVLTAKPSGLFCLPPRDILMYGLLVVGSTHLSLSAIIRSHSWNAVSPLLELRIYRIAATLRNMFYGVLRL